MIGKEIGTGTASWSHGLSGADIGMNEHRAIKDGMKIAKKIDLLENGQGQNLLAIKSVDISIAVGKVKIQRA